MSVQRQDLQQAAATANAANLPPRAELQDVTFAYREGQPIFEAFTWQITPGDAWAVIGPSGCGKSTLLYLLTGLRQPQVRYSSGGRQRSG